MAASKIQARPIMRANQPVPNMISAPQWADTVSLTGGAAKNYTIPSNISMIRLTPTVVPTYGSVTTTAKIPSGDETDGLASFPVGGQTYLGVNPGSTLSLICASNCLVQVECWT